MQEDPTPRLDGTDNTLIAAPPAVQPSAAGHLFEGPLAPLAEVAPLPIVRAAQVDGQLPGLPEHLLPVGLVGRGGSGEVHRVDDTRLGRVLALKVLQRGWSVGADAVARFRAEAQVTAQLEHPGIVPVYDVGHLNDGRLYFTMKLVRGQELGELIAALHAARDGHRWRPTSQGFTFRRLIDALRQVCQAVGYAHARGVTHRDLKPANVMIGAFGEVMVMDWGLAQIMGSHAEHTSEVPAADLNPTPMGQVVGTPAYMAPEQAAGLVGEVGPWTDVYALGALLYHVLLGEAPYRGAGGLELCRRVLAGPPLELTAARAPWAPEPLRELVAWAMGRDPAARPADARVLAREIEAWLDGDSRQRRALAVLSEAQELLPQRARLLAAADSLRDSAHLRRQGKASWQPAEDFADVWALEEQAEALQRQADLLDVKYMQGLRGALTHDPDLAQAHRLLASHYRAQLEQAEADSDERRAARAELLLREHDRANEHSAYLDGHGHLSLSTSPEGAVGTLYAFELEGRRLVRRLLGQLGPTPVVCQALPRGRYLVTFSDAAGREVCLPLWMERGGSVDFVRPGLGQQMPIPLPAAGALRDDEVYVPPGWFWAGGDRQAAFSLPRQRVWVDGFVVCRFPITNRQYLDFLNAKVGMGEVRQALLHQPRERFLDGEVGEPIYGRAADGRFFLSADAEGDAWLPDEPVTNIEWVSACAYARWRADEEGLPWRLPGELEWEKSARGVDGRRYPWGDILHPAWANMAFSRAGRPLPAEVTAFPLDESPYGVRGMAGNVRDWCLDRYRKGGPEVDGEGLYHPPLREVEVAAEVEARLLAGETVRRVERSLRGGAWVETQDNISLANRFGDNSGRRNGHSGFRILRQWPQRSTRS